MFTHSQVYQQGCVVFLQTTSTKGGKSDETKKYTKGGKVNLTKK